MLWNSHTCRASASFGSDALPTPSFPHSNSVRGDDSQALAAIVGRIFSIAETASNSIGSSSAYGLAQTSAGGREGFSEGGVEGDFPLRTKSGVSLASSTHKSQGNCSAVSTMSFSAAFQPGGQQESGHPDGDHLAAEDLVQPAGTPSIVADIGNMEVSSKQTLTELGREQLKLGNEAAGSMHGGPDALALKASWAQVSSVMCVPCSAS